MNKIQELLGKQVLKNLSNYRWIWLGLLAFVALRVLSQVGAGSFVRVERQEGDGHINIVIQAGFVNITPNNFNANGVSKAKTEEKR